MTQSNVSVNISNMTINAGNNQTGINISSLPPPPKKLSFGNTTSSFSNLCITNTSSAVFTIHGSKPPALSIAVDPSNVLTFHNNGEVTWTGNLSNSLIYFISMFKNMFDKELVEKRFERQVLQNCLELAKTKSKDEYIDTIQTMIDNNLSDAMLRELTKED